MSTLTGITLFTLLSLTTLSASPQSFMRRILFVKFPSFKKKKSVDSGDLILHGSDRWKTNMWKFLSSSTIDNQDCEINFVNRSNEIVLFCWVDFDGILHNYSPVNDGSIRDGSVPNTHLEWTNTSHVFVCLRRISAPYPTHISDVNPDDFVFTYRPTQALACHKVTLTQNKGSGKFSIDVEAIELVSEDTEVIDTSQKPYLTRLICGFTIKYESCVFENTPELIPCLEADLDAVCRILPSRARELLQKDTYFWINESLIYGPKKKPIVGKAMCFHPEASWLKRMGTSVEKAGCIEMYEVDDYIKSRGLWGRGGLLLHELCHAYHCKVVPDGYESKLVQEAYATAMASKLYDSVPVHGVQGSKGSVKAYACANCYEFFAELSVAFLFDPSTTPSALASESFISSVPAKSKSSSFNTHSNSIANEIHANLRGSVLVPLQSSSIDEVVDSLVNGIIDESIQTGEGSGTSSTALESQSKPAYSKEITKIVEEASSVNLEYNKWFPYNAAQLRTHDPKTYKVLESLWR